MEELTPRDPEDAEARRRAHSRRRIPSIIALVAFALIGIWIFRDQVPETARVSFEIPPTLFVDGGRAPRDHVEALYARVFDDSGELVLTSRASFPGGLARPVTSDAPMTLPTGDYTTSVELTLRDGRRVVLRGTIPIGAGPAVRVPLRH